DAPPSAMPAIDARTKSDRRTPSCQQEGEAAANGIPFAREMSLVRPTLLNRGSGLANDLDDNVRLGEHGDVAAVGLDRGRVHAFRQKALKIRMHRLVLLSEDVPARLRLPGNLVELLLLEQVGSGWVVGRPDQLLLLLGKV